MDFGGSSRRFDEAFMMGKSEKLGVFCLSRFSVRAVSYGGDLLRFDKFDKFGCVIAGFGVSLIVDIM